LETLLFGPHAAMRQFALLFACWAPQLVIRYPGCVTQDAFYSLAQYMGMAGYTTKHPLVYTLTFGWFVDLGRMMGHPNFGLFLFMVVQSVLVLCVMVYTIKVLELLNAPVWLRFVALCHSVWMT
jgi:hypothetical protein